MDYFDVLSIISERDKEIIKENPEDPVAQMITDIEGKIPKEIGERIVKEFNDKNNAYQIGIARTKGDFSEDAFKNGYKIFGGQETSFGISYYDNSYNELLYILHQCVAAPYYKSSDKVYIFKIPKENINYYENGKSMPILIPQSERNELNNEAVRILPEYVLGYITFDEEKNMVELIENPNYKDDHDYLPDGLLYDGRVEYDKKQQEKNNKGNRTEEHETENKEKLFTRIYNKIKEMILKKSNKNALPEGQEKETARIKDRKTEKISEYYVGEIKARPEFYEENTKNQQNKSENEYTK